MYLMKFIWNLLMKTALLFDNNTKSNGHCLLSVIQKSCLISSGWKLLLTDIRLCQPVNQILGYDPKCMKIAVKATYTNVNTGIFVTIEIRYYMGHNDNKGTGHFWRNWSKIEVEGYLSSWKNGGYWSLLFWNTVYIGHNQRHR
jgi:hypothetical protein